VNSKSQQENIKVMNDNMDLIDQINKLRNEEKQLKREVKKMQSKRIPISNESS